MERSTLANSRILLFSQDTRSSVSSHEGINARRRLSDKNLRQCAIVKSNLNIKYMFLLLHAAYVAAYERISLSIRKSPFNCNSRENAGKNSTSRYAKGF